MAPFEFGAVILVALTESPLVPRTHSRVSNAT